MFEAHHDTVLECVRRRELLSRDRLATLDAEQRRSGRLAVIQALGRGWLERGQLLAAIAEELGWPVLAAPPATVESRTLALLPAALARSYRVVPWRQSGEQVDVLAADPFDPQLAADLSFVLSRQVRLVVADPERVDQLVRQSYGPAAGETADDDDAAAEWAQAAGSQAPSAANGGSLPDEAPIVRFVHAVLLRAVCERASDVHFEPFEREFRIRSRVDGTLREVSRPPYQLALPVISRLKVMANLDIAERRLPQDGRIELAIGRRRVDLRVSTLPTQFGESVVLRVLDRAAVRLELGELGLEAEVRQGLLRVVRRPSGVLIVTGPTGSGKTTTLYSALREIDCPTRKVLTVEDPVEYEMEGVMQVPVNPAAGLSFASVLRSFLRQDPDVMMIGEIRDLDTAQIAMQAALTGHLVLTSLHTNDAPGAVTRLMDLGVEPYLIASTVEGVLAQRLVRRVCPACAEDVEPDEVALQRLGDEGAALRGRRVRRGRGCAACGQSGYRGRTGVFEWLRVSEPLRTRIAQRAPAWEIRDLAIAEGMQPLRRAAVSAVAAGLTTIEEIVGAC